MRRRFTGFVRVFVGDLLSVRALFFFSQHNTSGFQCRLKNPQKVEMLSLNRAISPDRLRIQLERLIAKLLGTQNDSDQIF
jgi:hypothetical protein